MKTLFLPSYRCLTPPSWGTPCDIKAIYTSLKSTFSGLQFRRRQYGSIFIRLAVIASETREMARNSKRIWPYSTSGSSNVIDLGVNRKRTRDFLLVPNSNYGHISYRFQDIDAFSSKIACFFPPNPCLTPSSGGTPWNITEFYIPLKSTFNGLKFCPWHYGSIFIRLAAVGFHSRKITWNSAKIWPHSSLRSSKVIDLGVNGKPICDFLLVINCNFSRICYRFRVIHAYT